MATSPSVKPRKKKGGWNVVEEPAPDPAPELIAGTSASVPKAALSISTYDVVTAHQTVLGGFRWRELSEGTIELTQEEKTQLLEVVLGGTPNVINVQNLFEALHVKNSFGWTIAGSCPEIVRVAKEFLSQRGVSVEPPELDAETQNLLDALNRREFPGVQQ
jgi:hypothetical protein